MVIKMVEEWFMMYYMMLATWIDRTCFVPVLASRGYAPAYDKASARAVPQS